MSGEPETRELPEEIEEGLLHDIQRGIVVPCKAEGQAHNPIPVTPVQDFEGVGIAAIDCGD